MIKIKLIDAITGDTTARKMSTFEEYNNCQDLIDYLRSLNIYRGEMRQVFSWPKDMLYFFTSHFREVSDSEQLQYLIIKYPHLLKVSDEN